VIADGKCENRSESQITSSFSEAFGAFLLRFSHRVPNWHGIGGQGIDCQLSRADLRASHRSIIRPQRTILRDFLPPGMSDIQNQERLRMGFCRRKYSLRRKRVNSSLANQRTPNTASVKCRRCEHRLPMDLKVSHHSLPFGTDHIIDQLLGKIVVNAWMLFRINRYHTVLIA
jgi:hypothetical protein